MNSLRRQVEDRWQGGGRTVRGVFGALALAGLCVLAGPVLLRPAAGADAVGAQPAGAVERELLGRLDAPLLFVKRHSYTGLHIYDTFYKWPPGGGGIYVLENPADPRADWKIRPVIDPTTPNTLGAGVYTHPEVSWDGRQLLFCFKGGPGDSTSIYEIGVDGSHLRRLTDPSPTCADYKGVHSGQHDIAPAYLPDGRIVFLSTRPSGLVPCANEGVSILHVMNADGSDPHPISVNNVNEFDPAVMPDGGLLFGRWEYVDKTALTQQSLWTINPDGTGETAFFANNMVFPEAILDARPVPGTRWIVGTFAPHNAPPRGSIALIDPRLGKNNAAAIRNLEHPDQPTHDRGESCEPWPVSADLFLWSGRPQGHSRNVIEIMDGAGRRAVVLSDPEICLHSPMLVKPRPLPPALPETVERGAKTGRFLVQDIYQGLTGVPRGEVKWLRVIEEASRVTARTEGSNPYNQTFLVSAALAFGVKHFLGMVPVEEDGSVCFEAPAGRALYFQALDGEGRLVQSMRTFVQAAPGTTRSCIGCHEHKDRVAANTSGPAALQAPPRRLEPERWGSGFLDYPSMIQPILDRHCAECHGGPGGMGGGIDLSGGWTEHFSISYENLVSRRETQLTAYWIAGIDCMNGTAHWSAQILPPRSHGSGAAPLAELIMEGHAGRLPHLAREERDLLFAWIDSNGLYHGTWNYTEHSSALAAWPKVKSALSRQMESAGCLGCHGQTNLVFENDWFNLAQPELSRLLRAPLPAGAEGFGLGLCRDREVDRCRQRVRLLWNGYQHAVQPLEKFAPQPFVRPDSSGEPVATFASTNSSHYQSMLAIIRDGREEALASPRVDMPGARVIAGASRHFVLPPAPKQAPPIQATVDAEGLVQLAWASSAGLIGLEAELHRSSHKGFEPGGGTLLARTSLFHHTDAAAPEGWQYYALQIVSADGRSQPAYAALLVPPPPTPPTPEGLTARPAPGSVRLRWRTPAGLAAAYHVYRTRAGANDSERITPDPIRRPWFTDGTAEPEVRYDYRVSLVSRRGLESPLSAPAGAAARPAELPVFTVALAGELSGHLDGGEVLTGLACGKARLAGGALDLTEGGHVTFPHRDAFDLTQPLTVECWAQLEPPGQSPVLVSCGEWRGAGWFLQRLGGTWRWHVGGMDCDGGDPVSGRWVHLAATFDGRTARLFQDGEQVAETTGQPNTAPWAGDLYLGQYSAGPGTAFQVTGKLAGLKIYHHALSASEAATAAEARPPSLSVSL